MLNWLSDACLSLEYPALGGRDQLTAALEIWRNCQDQIPRADGEYLDQVLRTLMAWKMPAQALLSTLLFHLMDHEAALPDAQDNLFSGRNLQMARDLAALVCPPVQNDDPEYLKRACRSDRLRQLFITAYTSLELVLLCLAHHVARVKRIKLLTDRDAWLLAEDNEAIFLPLAEMLGMWELRRELGDLSLEILNPAKAWDRIGWQQQQVTDKQRQYYEKIHDELLSELGSAEIEGDVCLHRSPASSIYRRMLRGEALEELVRKVKIDVIVSTEDECYLVLGLIHRQYPPLTGRTPIGSYFRDLIASPKFNGYSALVTTVGCRKAGTSEAEIPLEFRIRTRGMEQTNLRGVVAARFLSRPPVVLRNAWWESGQVVEFVCTQPVGSSTERVYVLSHTGEVYILPQDSTPIDFAYRVHSEVVHYCKHIRVNGRPASYAQKLRNGDLVEIELGPRHIKSDERYLVPSERWLEVVQTSTAKREIKRALKQRRITPHKGRKIIDKILEYELEAYNLEVSAGQVDRFLRDTARHLNYPNLMSLYVDIADPNSLPGSRKPSPNWIVARLIANQLADHVEKANGEAIGILRNRIRFAQCSHNKKLCRVVPGSPIVGRLRQQGTRHERLIVYRRDCPNAPKGETAIPLAWRGDKRPGEPVRVSIEAVDRAELLHDVLQTVYDLYVHGLYLLGVQADVTRTRSAHIYLTVDASSYRPVELLSEKLNRLREGGVIDEFLIDALSPIEKMLLVEPDALPNPYTPGQPARDRRIFKGRDGEVERIVTWLSGSQNSVVLYGMNRVGKTSLLCYLHDHIAMEYNFAPVLVNMLGLEEHDEATFWLNMATKIDEAISRLYRNKRYRSPSHRRRRRNTFKGFCEWLEEARAAVRGRKLLIMIDELNVLDELWDRSEALSVVYRLKSLVESQCDVAFLFCVQETLYREAASSDSKVISWPLLRAGTSLRLEYLERHAAEKLIREPMGQMLQYDDCLIERMLHLTACHPYYLQNMLHLIVEYVARSNPRSAKIKVTSGALEAIIPQLLENGSHLFHDFLREYRGVKRTAILSALACISGSGSRGATVDEIRVALKQRGFNIRLPRLVQTLEVLREMGIVKRREESGHARYDIRVPLFGHWLLENRPLYLIPS